MKDLYYLVILINYTHIILDKMSNIRILLLKPIPVYLYCPGPDCRRNENLQDTRYWSLIEQQIDFSFTFSSVQSNSREPEQNTILTFKDWVSLQQLILDVLVDPAVPGDGGDVLHHQLPRLRLPGPALPGQDDGLVLPVVPQQVPGPVSQGVTESK